MKRLWSMWRGDGGRWQDTDELRQQSCVKSPLEPPLLCAARVEQPENKIDRYAQTIPPFLLTLKQASKPPHLLDPPQGNYQTHGMVWWNPRKSEFLTSLSPSSLLHPSERLPSSFRCYKAESDLNNQLDFFPLQKRELFFFLVNFHLSTHSHTCFPPTDVCACPHAFMQTVAIQIQNWRQTDKKSRSGYAEQENVSVWNKWRKEQTITL